MANQEKKFRNKTPKTKSLNIEVLIRACRLKSFIDFLLNKGAKINTINNNGKTALIYIKGEEEFTIIIFLIANGTKIDVRHNKALSHICGRGLTYITQYLFKKDAFKIPYEVTAFREINTPDGNRKISSMHAYIESVEMNAYLIEKEMDINAVDFNGIPALVNACKEGSSIEIIKYLIERGADANALCNHGITALMYACKGGLFEIVEYLIENGAEINV